MLELEDEKVVMTGVVEVLVLLLGVGVVLVLGKVLWVAKVL